jgi:cold-inducible RNA-binding protein
VGKVAERISAPPIELAGNSGFPRPVQKEFPRGADHPGEGNVQKRVAFKNEAVLNSGKQLTRSFHTLLNLQWLVFSESRRSGTVVKGQPVQHIGPSMSTKLFVGNLSYNTTQNQLQDLFAAHGTVTEVDLIMDKFSGRPRGFGFVTMESKEAAEAAVQALNGKNIDGRALTVNEARPREDRPQRSGGYRDRDDRGGERREYRR